MKTNSPSEVCGLARGSVVRKKGSSLEGKRNHHSFVQGREGGKGVGETPHRLGNPCDYVLRGVHSGHFNGVGLGEEGQDEVVDVVLDHQNHILGGSIQSRLVK